MTGQTLAVGLVGASLGARRGAGAFALYVVPGLFLPLHAGTGMVTSRSLGGDRVPYEIVDSDTETGAGDMGTQPTAVLAVAGRQRSDDTMAPYGGRDAGAQPGGATL